MTLSGDCSAAPSSWIDLQWLSYHVHAADLNTAVDLWFLACIPNLHSLQQHSLWASSLITYIYTVDQHCSAAYHHSQGAHQESISAFSGGSNQQVVHCFWCCGWFRYKVKECTFRWNQIRIKWKELRAHYHLKVLDNWRSQELGSGDFDSHK